jgi:hypothetical protein
MLYQTEQARYPQAGNSLSTRYAHEASQKGRKKSLDARTMSHRQEIRPDIDCQRGQI